MELKNNLRTDTGWEIIENSFNEEQLVTTGSNFMIGNGYMGYRGTFEEWEEDRYVACIVTDTWDKSEGSRWSELCNVPNGLFTQLFVDGQMLSAFEGDTTTYYRALNMRHGLNQRSLNWRSGDGDGVVVEIEKFASLDNHHLLNMRYSVRALQATRIKLHTGIDGRVWSINGEHFRSYETRTADDLLQMELYTAETNTQVAVTEGIKIIGKAPHSHQILEQEKRILREYIFELDQGEQLCFEKVVSITHSNELTDPMPTALAEVKEGLNRGYDALKKDHAEKWDSFWYISDIQVHGNPEAQVLARFNIYQSYIATPTHDNLPVGARGLSCQVYLA